jgi:tetratricopeptide (TPR) repeat protein
MRGVHVERHLSELARLTRIMKDTDSAEQAFKIRAAMLGIVVAVISGSAGALIGGSGLFWVSSLAGVVIGIVAYFVTLFIADRVGTAGASIFSPGGSSTPPPRQYSFADSLAARGLLTEAAEAYERLSEEYPADPEPCVRHARLLRDRMSRPEEAADRFRKALAAKDLDAAGEAALLRELCELYMYKLQTPNKALPYLAQLAAKHPTHPGSRWAKAEAAEIRQLMQQQRNAD